MARYRDPGLCGVYLFRSRRNGACLYVGSSVNVQVRHKAHLAHLRAGIHHSRGLQRFWDKYGNAALDYEIIHAVVKTSDLRGWERHFIAELKPLFNGLRTDIAVGPLRHSPEAIAKMRQSHLGRVHPGAGAKAAATRRSAFPDGIIRLTKEHIEKAAAGQRGKVIPPSAREKMRAAKLGKSLTKEHAAKISAAAKGRPRSDQHRENLRLAGQRAWARRSANQPSLFEEPCQTTT